MKYNRREFIRKGTLFISSCAGIPALLSGPVIFQDVQSRGEILSRHLASAGPADLILINDNSLDDYSFMGIGFDYRKSDSLNFLFYSGTEHRLSSNHDMKEEIEALKIYAGTHESFIFHVNQNYGGFELKDPEIIYKTRRYLTGKSAITEYELGYIANVYAYKYTVMNYDLDEILSCIRN